MIYDRAEDMVATTKRHPSRTRHRTASIADGKLLAMDIDFVIDGGAYCTLSPVVLSRGTIHAAGPYFCPNVRIRSRAVATNVPPHGAFRGFGAPQSIFALERHMDKVAAAVGLTPEEFRRRNFIKKGRRRAVGQVIREPVDMDQLLDTRARAVRTTTQSATVRRARTPRRPRRRSGIGFATFMHGAGFTGSGEDHLHRWSSVEATRRRHACACSPPAPRSVREPTRSFRRSLPKRSASTSTRSRSFSPTRPCVPNSGPTVASRTCMVVGKLVESACMAFEADAGRRAAALPSRYTRADFQRGVPALHRQVWAAAKRQPSINRRRNALGRREVSGRRVWRLCVGGLRRRGVG